MLKVIKKSKRWFYIPFAIFIPKNVKEIVDWISEPNQYSKKLKRNSLMDCIVMLNILYLIILFKIILTFAL